MTSNEKMRGKSMDELEYMAKKHHSKILEKKFRQTYLIPMAMILTNHMGLRRLKNFCAKRGLENVLFFWLAVEDFRALYEIRSLTEHAFEIWDLYLEEDGDLFIDPPFNMRNDVKNILDRGKCSPFIFNKLQSYFLNNFIMTNIAHRFIGSTEYDSLVDEFGNDLLEKSSENDSGIINMSLDDLLTNPLGVSMLLDFEMCVQTFVNRSLSHNERKVDIDFIYNQFIDFKAPMLLKINGLRKHRLAVTKSQIIDDNDINSNIFDKIFELVKENLNILFKEGFLKSDILRSAIKVLKSIHMEQTMKKEILKKHMLEDAKRMVTLSFLMKGGYMLKYGRHRKPHRKFVYCDDSGRLYWTDKQHLNNNSRKFTHSHKFSQYKSFNISSIKKIIHGRESDVLKNNALAQKFPSNLFFSIITKDRVLNLQANSPDIADRWIDALNWAIDHIKKIGSGIASLNRTLGLPSAGPSDNIFGIERQSSKPVLAGPSLTEQESPIANRMSSSKNEYITQQRKYTPELRKMKSEPPSSFKKPKKKRRPSLKRAPSDINGKSTNNLQRRGSFKRSSSMLRRRHRSTKKRDSNTKVLIRKRSQSVPDIPPEVLELQRTNTLESKKKLLEKKRSKQARDHSLIVDMSRPVKAVSDPFVKERKETIQQPLLERVDSKLVKTIAIIAGYEYDEYLFDSSKHVPKSVLKLRERLIDTSVGDSEHDLIKHPLPNEKKESKSSSKFWSCLPCGSIKDFDDDNLNTTSLKRSSADSMAPLLEGTLYKKTTSSVVQRFTKKYFVLTTTALAYYSNKNVIIESGWIPLTEITTVHYHIEKQKGKQFTLHLNNNRSYVLMATSADIAKQWAVSISNAVRDANNINNTAQASKTPPLVPIVKASNRMSMENIMLEEPGSRRQTKTRSIFGSMSARPRSKSRPSQVKRKKTRSSSIGQQAPPSLSQLAAVEPSFSKPKSVELSQIRSEIRSLTKPKINKPLLQRTYRGRLLRTQSMSNIINDLTRFQEAFLNFAKRNHYNQDKKLFSEVILPTARNDRNIAILLLETLVKPLNPKIHVLLPESTVHTGMKHDVESKLNTSITDQTPTGSEISLSFQNGKYVKRRSSKSNVFSFDETKTNATEKKQTNKHRRHQSAAWDFHQQRCQLQSCNRMREPGSMYCKLHLNKRSKEEEEEVVLIQNTVHSPKGIHAPRLSILSLRQKLIPWVWSTECFKAIVKTMKDEPILQSVLLRVTYLAMQYGLGSQGKKHKCSNYLLHHPPIEQAIKLQENVQNKKKSTFTPKRRHSLKPSKTKSKSRRSVAKSRSKESLNNISAIDEVHTNFEFSNEIQPLLDKVSSSMRVHENEEWQCAICKLACEGFAMFVRDHCGGDYFNEKVRCALSFMLLNPLEHWFCWQDAMVIFNQRVINIWIWPSLFLAAHFSAINLRVRLMEDVNALLIHSDYNCDTILTQNNWHEWIIPLLYDIPVISTERSVAEDTLVKYVMNTVVMLCSRAFRSLNEFTSILNTVIRYIQMLWTEHKDVVIHCQLLLMALCSDIVARLHTFPEYDRADIVWNNLKELIESIRIFIFCNPSPNHTDESLSNKKNVSPTYSLSSKNGTTSSMSFNQKMTQRLFSLPRFGDILEYGVHWTADNKCFDIKLVDKVISLLQAVSHGENEIKDLMENQPNLSNVELTFWNDILSEIYFFRDVKQFLTHLSDIGVPSDVGGYCSRLVQAKTDTKARAEILKYLAGDRSAKRRASRPSIFKQMVSGLLTNNDIINTIEVKLPWYTSNEKDGKKKKEVITLNKIAITTTGSELRTLIENELKEIAGLHQSIADCILYYNDHQISRSRPLSSYDIVGDKMLIHAKPRHSMKNRYNGNSGRNRLPGTNFGSHVEVASTLAAISPRRNVNQQSQDETKANEVEHVLKDSSIPQLHDPPVWIRNRTAPSDMSIDQPHSANSGKTINQLKRQLSF